MKRLLIPVAVLLVAGAIAAAAMGLRGESRPSATDYTPPVLPTRTSAPPSVIPEPPLLPRVDDTVVVTVNPIGVTAPAPRGRHRTSQRVTRAADRINLVMEGTRKEWLFEQNPVDRRRVSGYLVDHEARQILAYQESDLRNEQQLRGWADALMMRFDPSVLLRLKRTDQREMAFGVTFTRYLAREPSRDGVQDVWWSDAMLLPLRLKTAHAGVVVTSTIDSVDRAVALAVLADPRVRFPTYESLDVIDARDRLH
jgi:hypothetical protein